MLSWGERHGAETRQTPTTPGSRLRPRYRRPGARRLYLCLPTLRPRRRHRRGSNPAPSPPPGAETGPSRAGRSEGVRGRPDRPDRLLRVPHRLYLCPYRPRTRGSGHRGGPNPGCGCACRRAVEVVPAPPAPTRRLSRLQYNSVFKSNKEEDASIKTCEAHYKGKKE